MIDEGTIDEADLALAQPAHLPEEAVRLVERRLGSAAER